MRRRDLILSLGGATLPPRLARARERQRLVGVLWTDKSQFTNTYDAALRRGLAESGFIEGSNLAFAVRYTNNDATKIAPLASELAALKPDVLVVFGSGTALGAHRVAPEVPIVGLFDGDPVAVGLFQDYARPGGMITGVTLIAAATQNGKMFEIIRELVPGLRGVGYMIPRNAAAAVRMEPVARAEAERLGLAFTALRVSSMDEIRAVFSSHSDAVGGIVAWGSPVLRDNLEAVAELAIAAKMPVMTIFREFTQRGFLVSNGPDVVDLVRRVGGYAAKILAGAKPSDLPVEQPQKFTLTINLKTAKALGLTVPASLLARVDEVIE